MTAPSKWLVPWTKPRSPRRTILGFAHAGGAAGAYRELARHLPEDIALFGIELPGRATRFREAPITDMGTLLAHLEDALSPLLEDSPILIGHSLGALIAFEVARFAERAGHAPTHLVVSGHGAPHAFTRRHGKVSAFSDAELRAHLVAIGTTPPEVLANDELMGLVLPIVRADFALHESYAHREGAPLSCPVSVVTGKRDAMLVHTEMDAWGALGARVAHHTIDATHDLLQAHAEAMATRALSEQ